MQFYEFILTGFFAGLVGSFFGIGGGIIIVSVLISFNSIEPRFAVGTSFFAIVISSAVASIYNNSQKRINFEIAFRILVTTIPGSLLGSFIVGIIPINLFNQIFSLLLFLFAILIYKKSLFEETHSEINPKVLSLILFFVGIITSTSGIGGGIIFTPLLAHYLGLPLINSIATSQFILAITSFFALLTHIYNSNIQINLAIPVASGAVLGSLIGAKLITKIPKQSINLGLGLIIIGFALYLFSKSI
ncbi:MAG: sulfite exporter TauE/SafE family protein [Bacteroidetes bacterium]|nr:sulfite exporter TauE/SafE family protein [Bacteroidota bacterium]